MVDDILATGGTAAATVELVEASGATVVAVSTILELHRTWRASQALGDYGVHTLWSSEWTDMAVSATRVLPWRRDKPILGGRVGATRRTLSGRGPPADHSGLPDGRRGTSASAPQVGRAVHRAPAGGCAASWPISGWTTHDCCCAAPRRRRGHRVDWATWKRCRTEVAASSMASPSSTGSGSIPRKPSRRPRSARCWWRWQGSSGPHHQALRSAPQLRTIAALPAGSRNGPPGDPRRLRPAGQPPWHAGSSRPNSRI